ncbi:hypothetical protein MPLSOD_40496 [Mesorhizobium sp. SOD10]|nr:hypothetical protein MPLSOD_40496 [Mesorhizobium sp. SOD10]
MQACLTDGLAIPVGKRSCGGTRLGCAFHPRCAAPTLRFDKIDRLSRSGKENGHVGQLLTLLLQRSAQVGRCLPRRVSFLTGAVEITCGRNRARTFQIQCFVGMPCGSNRQLEILQGGGPLGRSQICAFLIGVAGLAGHGEFVLDLFDFIPLFGQRLICLGQGYSDSVARFVRRNQLCLQAFDDALRRFQIEFESLVALVRLIEGFCLLCGGAGQYPCLRACCTLGVLAQVELRFCRRQLTPRCNDLLLHFGGIVCRRYRRQEENASGNGAPPPVAHAEANPCRTRHVLELVVRPMCECHWQRSSVYRSFLAILKKYAIAALRARIKICPPW